MGTDADDTVLAEVLGCILADVRDVGGELFRTALGVAHLGQELVNVD